jgi:hypothetical protein
MPKIKHTTRASLPTPAPSTPLKKAKLSPITNPYATSVTTAGKKYINHIDAASTSGNEFVICLATKYDNKKQAFLYDIKKEFANNADWKITTFMARRDPLKPGSNEYLYEVGTDYVWYCIVCQCTSEDDSAVSIGSHIANVFTDFNVKLHASQKPKVGIRPNTFPPAKFEFRNDFTSDPPKPLNFYLTDWDALKLLKQMYSKNNKRSTVVENDDLLVDYFGTADLGREMLQMMSDDDWDKQDGYKTESE